jgi:hypothetical protein
MNYNTTTYRLEDTKRLVRVPLILALLAFSGLVSYAANHSAQFYHSYLNAFLFWLGLGLGGLFFTMLHHLTSSIWSVVLRRIAEALANTLPLLAILFIPILFGLHDLYPWSHSAEVAADPSLLKKAGYLNPTFFTIRAVIYFVVWSLLAWRLGAISDAQDKGANEAQKGSFIRFSAPGMILFAVTVSFAAFDWMMSLFPKWYSTIYGVYFGMGSIMATLAVMALIIAQLRRSGALKNEITEEHYHDLGKLLFAFVILWTYMAFSQYFLIWYANIPEETIYYRDRWIGSWKAVSLLIVFGSFVIPFLVLISRPAKRNLKVLVVVAIWLLLMHWTDLFWNIEPTLHTENMHIAPSDFTAMIGIGALFFWRFWSYLTKRPLMPVGDPKLEASIHTISK